VPSGRRSNGGCDSPEGEGRCKNDRLKSANEDNLNVADDKNPPHVPLPSVVSPPSAPNLNSLLTGHIGQEVGKQDADNGIATDKGSNTQEDEQVDDNVKSPKNNKSKKLSQQKKINQRSATVAVRASKRAPSHH
jgi:hypothetical protein